MKTILFLFLAIVFVTSGFLVYKIIEPFKIVSGAPPYYIAEDTLPFGLSQDYAWIKDWERPPGPPRVGLQVGHWKNDEIPQELERLRGNTGAEGGGATEVEVNLAIAELTKGLLEEKGVIVDILPATVPQNYWADVFLSIHADGSLDYSKSGYKGAIPRRDFTESADELLKYVEESYAIATGLPYDPNVTRNMRGYYAFSFWRFDHAIHPMTTAMILETGFLSNYNDRQIILERPEVSADGIAEGITKYFEHKELL